MPSRTQIVCLHEGRQGRSIDGVFINRLMRALHPEWLRWEGSNIVRLIPCGGRKELIQRTPDELKNCLRAGAHTTLMVWADLNHDMPDGEALKEEFRKACEHAGVSDEDLN